MRRRLVAALLAAGVASYAAEARALLIDDFEGGGFAFLTGCPPPPGADFQYLAQNIENGVSGALGGRREVFVNPSGPLFDGSCGSTPSEGGNVVRAELSTGPGDDGVLFVVTNNHPPSSQTGAFVDLVYRLPDFGSFDLTDAGGSDTLQIRFAEVGGPTEMTIFGGSDFTRFAVDGPGTLRIPLDGLFGCAACADVTGLERLTFEFFAPGGAHEQRIHIADIRTVPEPSTALLLLAGLVALANRGGRGSR